MPRRKEPPAGRVSPRRSRRDDRKPQALMDIVVGAVRRLGALMGVSVTDIERCAVAEGDLPARVGARNILRLGLNRAVETGRLQRMPGGLFRLPDDEDLVAEKKLEAHLNDVSSPSAERRSDITSNKSGLLGASSTASVVDSDLDSTADGSVAMEADLEEEQAVHLPRLPHACLAQALPLQLGEGEDEDGLGLRRPRCHRSPDNRLLGPERTAADHGRAAAAGLFKLSADVIAVIAQTASARLNAISGDGPAPHGEGDEDDGDELDDKAGNTGSARHPKKKKGDESVGTSASNLATDTQRVVGATGTAVSEIAAATTQGSNRVIEVAASGDPDSNMSGTTRDNIFRTFKEAAMDIVRAARAFGEALGGTDVVDHSERPGSGRSRDSHDEELYDTLPLHIGPDLSAVYPEPGPDMEDFLRNLLQDVRELAQRVGKCIN